MYNEQVTGEGIFLKTIQKKAREKETRNNIIDINRNVLLITLNISGLNSTIKRLRMD